MAIEEVGSAHVGTNGLNGSNNPKANLSDTESEGYRTPVEIPTTNGVNGKPNGVNGNGTAFATPVSGLSTPGGELETSTKEVDKPVLPPPPPPFLGSYNQDRALEDLPGCRYALDLFLKSHMVECEEYCHSSDPEKERMYFSLGYALIQCVKALMSFEDEDLLAAIGHTKHGNQISQQHRKKAASITSRLASFVVGSGSSSGVGFIKSMTQVERHAELIYAETLFEKALLGIMYSGDWLAFVKEALNLRATVNTYRDLGKFIDAMDAEAVARGEPFDQSIDHNFRSGVYLGVGSSNMFLSLMPGKLLHIMEIFGFKGDRMEGLRLLAKAGGWDKDKDEPSVSIADEGVRRPLCDMSLLIFHLVLSSFTVHGVDIPFAQKILDWNLKRYPNGVFFLFGQGRIRLIRGQPALAIESYKRAMSAQSQYRNLHHISNWEMAIANISLWEIEESKDCWAELEKDATWSKSCYTYGVGVCYLQLAQDARRAGKEKEGGEEKWKKYEEEAKKFILKAPELVQRIAGKSIPVEKFISRKSRKFQSQNSRLTLPVLEFGYFFLIIKYAPRRVILEKMIPEVEATLAELKKHEARPKGYYEHSGGGYWDDWCLAQLLHGVCWRYVVYPDADAIVDPNEKLESLTISMEEAEKRAMNSLNAVLDNVAKIELDHYLIYHAHYEIGRLHGCMGKTTEARKHLDLVLSGKHLEVGHSRKGKYSMENALSMRTNAAVEALDQGRRP